MSEHDSFPKQAHRSPRGWLIMTLVLLAALATALAAIIPAYMQGTERRRHRIALTPDKQVEGLSIPQFTLTNQFGETVTQDALVGHLTVMDFVFTNCPFVCPTLTQKMLWLQQELADTGLRLFSVSVDPEHDTPERLREHAERIGADPDRWTFATGPWEEVVKISENGLRLGLSPDTDPERAITLEDGTQMRNISHTSKLVLIGPDGRVLGLYSGLEQADVEQLAERARLGAWTR